MIVLSQRSHVARSRRVKRYICLYCNEELTLLGVSALAERPRITAAAKAKERSIFRSKRQIQFRSKVRTEKLGCIQKPEQIVLGFKPRIRKNRWCTLFGSWSIIYDFPLQLFHWVERFYIMRFYLSKHRDLCHPPSLRANILVRLFSFSFLIPRGFFHHRSAHPLELGPWGRHWFG